MSDLVKDIEKLLNETGKYVEKTVNSVEKKINKEVEKLDIKSQIGHHERTLRKTYQLLGEAYFLNKIYDIPLENEEALLEIVKSNKKIIDLLNKQLLNIG